MLVSPGFCIHFALVKLLKPPYSEDTNNAAKIPTHKTENLFILVLCISTFLSQNEKKTKM